MTGCAPMPSDAPDIAETLGRLWPEMRRAQGLAWLGVVALTGLGLQAIPGLLRNLGGDKSGSGEVQTWVFMGAVVGIILVYGAIRRHHERMVMPELARTLGLSYRDSDKGLVDALPSRLLPKASRRTAEDVLRGRIGDRDVTFAEVKVETGGKNSTVYFDGIVMEFRNVAPLPAFFVAPQKETELGWFGTRGRIAVDDLVRLEQVLDGSEAFGVWASSQDVARHPAFRAVLMRLTSVHSAGDIGARLYSAMSDGTRTWVAIRQKRDLFRIGGLFATRDAVLADIRHAYDDMQQPYRIVTALLQAEQEAAAAGGQAGA
jgi:hypothetical protein